MESLNVTLRFKFPDGSVGGDPWDHSHGPLDVCGGCECKFLSLFSEHSSVIISIGLSVLTCAIYTILSRAKVLYIHQNGPHWK